ncbi:MAG: FeoA family protein [Leptospira sp.]|jgi:Fe2+ transport system protein FeoA|nr:FeoA family protein [Leptospira sp.]
MKPLSELQKNQPAKIINFDRIKIGDSHITELLELGFYPGAIVECLDASVYLNKMILLVGGTKVALRLSDCHHINVSEEPK